jgi:hypothetical protein
MFVLDNTPGPTNVTDLIARFNGASAIVTNTTAFHLRYMAISLTFRTVQSASTLVWLAGDKDFLEIGIAGGFLYVIFNLGGGRATLRSSVGVSDGQWHSVSFTLSLNIGALYVDAVLDQESQAPGQYVVFDGFEGPVLGSPAQASRDFFRGEMRGVVYNGRNILLGAFNDSEGAFVVR